ncbi:helix-turn-helix transcriptional regulator [Brevundimonas sp. NIBR11]|uniref:helix-turn-helix domain-containing protein n=1 Tax=Brevundimonas sp. NIBR11 TaxID=3015999 RepID=UPI0022F065F9|nr:helix-turn-helix transcriptional regulator [Brevundimonas sp. NIBR11]WGM31473.1 hypothetical protein KKHFBJBL_01720 [Brevundimonas sp. NIBR11]
MQLAERRRAHFLDWLDTSDWNAKSLAEHAGIPYTTLHSYTKSSGSPTRSLRGDTEAQLASAVGLRIEDLFGSPSPTNFIRPWRLSRFWTEAELAEKIGSDEAYVRGVEAGEIPLSPKVLARFADAFGVGQGRLRTDPDDVNVEAAELFSDIAPEDRPRALEMLRVFKRTGTDG